MVYRENRRPMHLHLAVGWRAVLVQHMPEKRKQNFQSLKVLGSVYLQNLETAVLNNDAQQSVQHKYRYK